MPVRSWRRPIGRLALAVALSATWLSVAGSASAADTSLWPPEGAPSADQLRIIEGDILTGPRITPRGMGLSAASDLWSFGVVPYIIDENLSAISVTQIDAAIQSWNESSGITLTPRDQLTTSQGVDYLRFQAGPGCASWVGRQGGEQAIWVAPTCSAGSLIHEIGHAIGLEHEHTRPDRDQYIAIRWDNIDPDKRHNFDTTTRRSRPLGAYDFESIMHYGPTFFSRNGEPTIEPLLPTTTQLGQRVAPSAGDLAAIAQLYGTDLSLATQVNRLSDGRTEVSLQVSNDGIRGAHELTLELSLQRGRVLSQSDNSWLCSGGGDGATCTLERLAGESSSVLVILMEGGVRDVDVTARVRTKTPELDISDNQSPAAPAAALPPDAGQAYRDADGAQPPVASGGGAALWLAGLLLIRRPRRRR